MSFVDPVIVVGPWPVLNIAGVSLPTYYIVISAVMLLSVFYVQHRALTKQYSASMALDLFLVVSLTGALGARLFHVVFEEPRYYLDQPLAIFYFWQGGFVFYGGVIAGFLGGWWLLTRKNQPLLSWLDFFAPIISLGYSLGRWACFFAGCCYGKVCNLPWSYGFRQFSYHPPLSTIVHRHPTQLYFVVSEFCLFLFLIFFEKTKWCRDQRGRLFAVWLGAHALLRLIIEIFRDDFRGPTWGLISPSFLLSLLFFSASIYFLVATKKSNS